MQCGWDAAKATKSTEDKAGPSSAPKSKVKPVPKTKPVLKNTPASNATKAVAMTLAQLKRQAGVKPTPPSTKKPRPTSATRDPRVHTSPARAAQPTSAPAIGGAVAATRAVTGAGMSTEATYLSTTGRKGGKTDRSAIEATASSPRKKTKVPVSSPTPTRMPLTERVLAPFLHVSTLSSTKVRGKEIYSYDTVHLKGIKCRVYSKDLVIREDICFRPIASISKPKDLSIDAWKIRCKYNESDEYLVDCIAAERRVGGKKSDKEYLVKYTGFELDVGPENWQPLSEVDETEALDRWLKEGREKWMLTMAAVKEAAVVA